MTFWVLPVKNVWEQRRNKGSSVFFGRNVPNQKRKLVFYFFKAIFDTSFRPLRPVFGGNGTDLFKRYVNAIAGRNLPET